MYSFGFICTSLGLILSKKVHYLIACQLAFIWRFCLKLIVLLHLLEDKSPHDAVAHNQGEESYVG